MRPLAVLLALLCLGSVPGACSAPTAGPAPGGTTHAIAPGGEAPGPRPARMLRAVLRLTADGLEVVGITEAKNTVNRRDPLRDSATFWRAFDAGGNLVEERGFRLETRLRSEAPGADGVLEGFRVPLAEPVFDLTVPLRPGLRTVRLFRAVPGCDRDRAEALGEIEIPESMAP